MALRRQPIIVGQGDTHRMTFRLVRVVGPEKTAYDLVAKGVTLTVKASLETEDDDAMAVYEATITDAAAGECEVRLTLDATAKAGSFVYHMRVREADGAQRVVRAGEWKVEDL